MAKVLGGDWKELSDAVIVKSITGKFDALMLRRGLLNTDRMRRADILSADLVTTESQTSIAAKMGWGAVGGLALGAVGLAPLGLLAGVLGGGNRNVVVVAVVFRDGRKVLLQGKSKELMPLIGAAI